MNGPFANLRNGGNLPPDPGRARRCMAIALLVAGAALLGAIFIVRGWTDVIDTLLTFEVFRG